MKLLLAIFLIGVFVQLAMANILPTTITGIIKETTSDVIHKNCRLFADAVKENPIKEPYIEKVSFQLRTPCGVKEMPVTEARVLRDDPEFDANKTTIVFVTGWLVGPTKHYIADMAKAFHCRGDYNFLVANTGGFITNVYLNSAYHTGKLGEFIATGLRNMYIPSEKIHLIGHSLGAQIVGSAGRHYYELTGNKIQRITGLDPARPCFKSPVVFPRLSQDDAVFVDIIHSNPSDLGVEEAVGDADYYPGGLNVIQNGCSRLSLLCSHERAIVYFIESIYPGFENSYMATSCETHSEMDSGKCSGPKSPMGYATDLNARGIYYLTVRRRSPHGNESTFSSDLFTSECGSCRGY